MLNQLAMPNTRCFAASLLRIMSGTWRYFRLANSNSQRDVEFTYLCDHVVLHRFEAGRRYVILAIIAAEVKRC